MTIFIQVTPSGVIDPIPIVSILNMAVVTSSSHFVL